MRHTTYTQIRNLTIVALCLFALFAFSQIVSAHGGGEDEEASESLVHIVPAAGENYHIEIEAETLDGKRIPELSITAVITSIETGEVVEKMLHGMFGGNYHYGSNAALPEGEYFITFHIDPPTFMREGSRAGSWIEPIDAEVTFSAVTSPEDEFEMVIKTTEDMVIVFVAEPAQEMWVSPGGVMADMHEDDHDDMEGMTNDAMEEMTDDHDGERSGIGSLLIAVLALILGGALGFFFGRSRKPEVSAPENSENTENQE